MTLFVDASALIAIIAEEPDKDVLEYRISRHEDRLWSAMSCWETVSGLRRSYKHDVSQARQTVQDAAEALELRLVTVGDAELRLALEAYEVYGKGRHRAALNMGDCFAYACTKTNGAKLLYKGADFSHTDIG